MNTKANLLKTLIREEVKKQLGNRRVEQKNTKLKNLIKQTILKELKSYDFTKSDEFDQYLYNTEELEGATIIVDMIKTYAAPQFDKSGDGFDGKYTFSRLKRTNQAPGKLVFDARLDIIPAGNELWAPLKGKTISLTLPAAKGDSGGFESDVKSPEGYNFKGSFSVKSLQIL